MLPCCRRLVCPYSTPPASTKRRRADSPAQGRQQGEDGRAITSLVAIRQPARDVVREFCTNRVGSSAWMILQKPSKVGGWQMPTSGPLATMASQGRVAGAEPRADVDDRGRPDHPVIRGPNPWPDRLFGYRGRPPSNMTTASTPVGLTTARLRAA
jgi:hypothetical protein